MRRVGILLCGLSVLLAAGLVGASGFAIDAPGAVESPQPIEQHGFTASSVLVVDPGDDGEFAVTGPADERFNLTLYDSDARPYQPTRTVDEPTTVTWSFDGVDPGSYVMAVVPDTKPVAVQPVLVRGYELSVSTAVDGDTATVTVEPTQTADGADAIQELMVSVETASGVQNVTAESSGDTYEAEIDVGSFEAGDHRLLAVARGDRAFRDEREVIAFSRSTLTVSQDGGDPGASTTEVTTATSTTTTAVETTTTTTDTPTSASETTETTSPSDGGAKTSETGVTTSDGDATTTAEDVIQPRTETPTTTGGPGFSAGLALVATLAAAVAIGRRG